MAYISSFTYCDSIQTQFTPEGPQKRIVNPLQVLSPIAIPGNYSFSISCNIADVSIGDPHTIIVEFVGPNDTRNNNPVKVNFSLDSQMIDQEKSFPGIALELDMRNTIIKEDGIHTTRVLLDNELLGEYKIKVIKG